MPKDTCCGCFHITTGAAVMGVLQAIIVVLLLSTSSILLQRSQIWKMEYEDMLSMELLSTVSTISTSSPTPSTSSGAVLPVTWFDNSHAIRSWRESGLLAFIEIHLTHHIAFYSLWIVFLGMFALAFKTYRTALVVPNLIMQVIAVAMIMILGGVIIAKLVFLSLQYEALKNNDVEREALASHYAFYSVLLGCLVIGWVAELIFIWVGIDFYHYLRDMQHTVYPSTHVHTTIAGTTMNHAHRSQEPQVFAASIETTTPKIHGEAMA